MPVVRTTARSPASAPSVGSPVDAALASSTKLPGRWVACSTSGALQQTRPTSRATSPQRRIDPRRSSGSAFAIAVGVAHLARITDAARPSSATAVTASAGAANVRWLCVTKLARSTSSGSRRCSPQATDQPTKIRSRNGSSGTDEFHTSLTASPGSERSITGIAIAVANMNASPPRRRASATTPITAATLSRPAVAASDPGCRKRAGSANSQNSRGPGAKVRWSRTPVAPLDDWPTSGVCELRTSNARIATMALSPRGVQSSAIARTIPAITGNAAASPAATTSRPTCRRPGESGAAGAGAPRRSGRLAGSAGAGVGCATALLDQTRPGVVSAAT
jgi:hypothetical protein